MQSGLGAKRLVVAMTGATGAIYGVRLLEQLAAQRVETHLIVSRAGWMTLAAELKTTRSAVESLASVVHSERDIGASIASGSFRTDGMIIAPCSTKTLAAIATGLSDNLVGRAADVILKEKRRLLLMVRETPLHLVHLRNMTTVAEMGGIIFPPVPAFYSHLKDLNEMVDQTVGRVLDLFGLESPALRRWEGLAEETRQTREC
jgi:4-hydroxy-3-polyprenylbenzoate decarboxylase